MPLALPAFGLPQDLPPAPISVSAAAIATPLYGDAQYDQNCLLPVNVPIGGKRLAFDVNMTVFLFISVLLVIAMTCLMQITAI